MTHNEAILIIKAYQDKLKSSCSNQLDKDIVAFEMAIEALDEQYYHKKLEENGYVMTWVRSNKE